MSDTPRTKRRRATTEPRPVWERELDKLQLKIDEPVRVDPPRLAIVPDTSVHALLEGLAKTDRSEYLSALVALGTLATDDLLEVVDRAPVGTTPRDASTALRVLGEIRDPRSIERLLVLLGRHSHTLVRGSLRASILDTLATFGELLAEPAIRAFHESSDAELRALLLESLSAARVTDERALALAIAELDEEPHFAAGILGDWGDARAIDGLRRRLARVDRNLEPDWFDTVWELTEALLRLGAVLHDGEKVLRRSAIWSKPGPVRASTDQFLDRCQRKLHEHPAGVARVLAHHADASAIPMLRHQLTWLRNERDAPWPCAPRIVTEPSLDWASAIVAITDAILVLDGSLDDSESSARAVARARLADGTSTPLRSPSFGDI
jgi:hypothetical protein